MEGLQVDAKWNGDGIRRPDAVELFAGEAGRAHHGVVVGGRSPIGEVSELLCGSPRKYLARKAIKALVGDHHRGGAVFPAPAAQ